MHHRATPPTTSPDRSALGPIMIVEDDPTQRMVSATIAGQTGHPVVEVADAPTAMRLLADPHAPSPALVVLDVDLDGASGLDVLRAIREQPRHHTLPVVLLTGHDDVQARIGGLEAGASDYVGKPVHPQELRARIDAQLRATTSWRQVIDADLLQRSRLAGTLARAAAATEGDRLRTAVVQAVCQLPGIADVDVVGVTEGAVEQGRLRSSTAARMLSELPTLLLRRRMGEGPWLHRTGSGAVLVCVPLVTPRGDGGLLVVQHDPLSGVQPDRVMSAAIDAAGIIAVSVGDQLLGDSTLAAQRQGIDDIIATGAFHPVFQPVIDLATGAVVGFEGLTRFEGRRPDHVFAEAARVGRSRELHRATFAAFAAAAVDVPEGCYLAINVSPDVLLDPEIGSWLPQDVPVVLEVTEHEQIADYTALVDAVRALGPGVRLAVDDAGSGFASLHHILALAPDIVKLDRSMIEGIHRSPGQEAMVAGLVHFAALTGSRLIAEGVEDEAESTVLRRLGVGYGQGWLYGHPADLPAPAMSRVT